ncbi:hypothetical protein F5X96DRAFT_668526 [Biscogniauxia mediterranea]|nr:hypothetical protein F5X96DRAFT_668526 [Biscogniauxia mediterranea]
MSEAKLVASGGNSQAIVFDKATSVYYAQQDVNDMLIDMNIWYPNGIYRSPVLNSGRYWTPAHAYPLPAYVVPPRFWPGINFTTFYKTPMSVSTESSTLSVGESSQASEGCQPTGEQGGQEDTGAGIEENNNPNSNSLSTTAAATTTDHPASETESQAESEAGPSQQYSANYNGDLSNPFNQSAEIPDSENCSVFVTELPAHTSYQRLFRSLRDVGKIAHCHINAPTPPQHRGTAAKIVFFDRAGVNRLLAQLRAGTFTVGGGGRCPRVTLNRIRVAPMPRQLARTSRVLEVYGPAAVAGTRRLRALWAAHGLAYDLEDVAVGLLPDEIDEVTGAPVRMCGLAFRFASCRAQALRARAILIAEKRRVENLRGEEARLWARVWTEWGVDPCDRVTEVVEDEEE